MSGAQCTRRFRHSSAISSSTGTTTAGGAAVLRQQVLSESLLPTTFIGEGHPHANENGPRNSTLEGRSVTSMPTEVRHGPTCPACGNEAVQVCTRRDGPYMHSLDAVCKLGHVWSTRWFAVGGA